MVSSTLILAPMLLHSLVQGVINHSTNGLTFGVTLVMEPEYTRTADIADLQLQRNIDRKRVSHTEKMAADQIDEYQSVLNAFRNDLQDALDIEDNLAKRESEKVSSSAPAVVAAQP